MANRPIIILCGGNINYSNLPIATNVSNAMIPVNGKPVIGWIMDEVLNQGFNEVVVVVQEKHKQLINFIRWAYEKKTNLKFTYVEPGGTINNSLEAGLSSIESNGSVSVNLGDTLVKDAVEPGKDYVLVADYEDPSIWCLTETDERQVITRYYDKEKVVKPGLKAIVGYYNFTNSSDLLQACKEANSNGEKELSSVLKRYGSKNPIKAISTRKWFDFGHISHFLEAKKEFLQSRFFNRLVINHVEGTIEKISTRTEKLEDELNWYNELPEKLKILSPRVLEQGALPGDKFHIVQEYYGYPNMAELFLYGNFDIEIWKTAINNLLRTHEYLKKFSGDVSQEDAASIYRDKTWSRLDQLQAEDEFFASLLKEENIRLNGKSLKNIPQLKDLINKRADQLCSSVRGTVVHGDYCLSNILYDVNNQIIRLIDPRGSFGKKGVYGDPRYDIAKLRHSFAGAYDYIVSDLFSLSYDKNTFEREIFRDEADEELSAYLDKRIIEIGYDIDDIIFIEALLFLSMVPLHKDKPERQKVMYLRAIELFNQIF